MRETESLDGTGPTPYAALTIQARPLLWVLAGAAVLIAATILLVTNLYREPTVTEPERHIGSAWEDFEVQRQRDLEHLHSYGWIDQRRQIAHIPVEQAMQILLRQRSAGPGEPSKQQGVSKP